MEIEFTPYELGLLQQALTRAASRHESEAKFGRTSKETANRHNVIDNGTRYAVEVKSWDMLTERKRKG